MGVVTTPECRVAAEPLQTPLFVAAGAGRRYTTCRVPAARTARSVQSASPNLRLQHEPYKALADRSLAKHRAQDESGRPRVFAA